jgi:hypothetical protein
MTFVRGLNDDTGYTIWHVWSDSPRDNATNLRILSFAALREIFRFREPFLAISSVC